MIYKGKEIPDVEYVLVEEEPFMEYSSNYVDFDLDELEHLTDLFKKKQKELEDSGLDFKNLSMVFTAKDYWYNPNGADEDDEAKFYFTYQRRETEKESEDRMLRCMARIDRDEAEKVRLETASVAVKDYELEQAKKLLEKNGYFVDKDGHKKKKKKKKSII